MQPTSTPPSKPAARPANPTTDLLRWAADVLHSTGPVNWVDSLTAAAILYAYGHGRY